MIYKITLSILGDSFYPDSIIELIEGQFLITNKNNPLDKKIVC